MKLQNLIHIVIGIVCIGLLPGAKAVVPPSDGGNTASSRTKSCSKRIPVCSGSRNTRDAGGPARGAPVSKHKRSYPEIETVSSAPSTRSSFMANWENIAGATGYLLDVSTNDSFSDYVDGYHDLDVGNVNGRVVTGLNPGTTYYYRVRPYTASGPASYSEAMTATTVPTTGLNIHATFDSSITGNPNAAAIQAMINRAISIYESLFSDPITIQILFRYATTVQTALLCRGGISRSVYAYYTIPWNTAVDFLRADARTSNDNLAIASLPGSALSANVMPSSANGRAVGGNTPPAMFANGTVGMAGRMMES